MSKVVLDTNVVVSGLISPKGAPRKILKLWQTKKINLVVSQKVIDEILDVLKRPKIKRRYQLSEEKIKRVKKSLEKDCAIIEPKQKLEIIVEDPADDKFLACALQGKAKWIISGDKHLLKLKSFKNIKIVTPREFLKILEK